MEDIILLNNLEGCILYELYAGGAGASLTILSLGLCNKVVLNDLDFHIYAFWHSILNRTDEFLKLVRDTDVNVDTWDAQRLIYEEYQDFDILEVGFSTFFLNRCNRSGILYKAGPIGGRSQVGNYKIDVRFNKEELIRRIEIIARLKDKIEVKSVESIALLKTIFSEDAENEDAKFIFLDPPYYIQGERLYLNFYKDDNHVDLRDNLSRARNANWFLTYDNCKRINELYGNFRKSHLPMSYTLQEKKKSKEVMIFSDSLHLPKKLRLGPKSFNYNVIEPIEQVNNVEH